MSQASPLERGTPEAQGVASSAISHFIEAVDARNLGLHSFMLLRHGRVVAEAWWRPFAPQLPHILYSLTKSFTSTAAGFAVGEGKLDLDDPVLKFFPGDAPKNPSEHWQAMKVRHLLSMTTGHAEDPGAQVSQYPPSEWLRRIFETTVPYAPGTHFVYNSTASHLVSIIVQKLTGQTLVNFLRDRLFRPLGISRPYWETDPMGANWGGWGLYLHTDEIARFGQTLLQRGVWRGQQVIPAEWVDQATRKQVPNGEDPNSDWAQGYGFQFWMSRHGYRGDGAFGQFCVVLPEEDAALVTTASTPDMQAVLNVAWATLLPGMEPGALAENPGAAAALRERLAGLEIEHPAGGFASAFEAELLRFPFRLDPNPLGWEALALRRDGDALTMTLTIADQEPVIRFGTRDWQNGTLRLDMPADLQVAATARWTGGMSLEAVACYLLPAARRTFKISFTVYNVEVRTTLFGTFATPQEVVLHGIRF